MSWSDPLFAGVGSYGLEVVNVTTEGRISICAYSLGKYFFNLFIVSAERSFSKWS